MCKSSENLITAIHLQESEECIVTEIVDGKLVTNKKMAEISNSIFDGESMMDESLFSKYKNRSMLLLRNRFFKSACFKCKLQKWFKDNNITEVSQLNGFTLATDISQIKIITTPSSIKYLKFGTLEQWFENYIQLLELLSTKNQLIIWMEEWFNVIISLLIRCNYLKKKFVNYVSQL